jgi:hypothetical protein
MIKFFYFLSTAIVILIVIVLEKYPFCPADAAIVANIPLADICMIY